MSSACDSTHVTLIQLADDDAVIFSLRHEQSPAFFFGTEVLHERSEDALKRLYKRLALKLHPDKNSHTDAGRAFQILQSMFEATLAAFSVPPAPAMNPAPAHASRDDRQRTWAHGSHSSSAPPPPPQQQWRQPPPAQRAPKVPTSHPPPPPPHAKQSKQHPTHSSDFEDIPLPPDVFGDMEWDNWTDRASSAKGTHSTPMPPPPPPPPPFATSRPPNMPPTPPFAGSAKPPSSAQACNPSSTPAASHHASAKATSAPGIPLPLFDDSGSDDDSSRQQKQSRRKPSAPCSERRGGDGVYVASSGESDEDVEALVSRRYAAAKRRRLRQEELQASTQERGKKRMESTKSLKQLFSEFGISDDEMDQDEAVPISGAGVKGARKGNNGAAITPTVLQGTAGNLGATTSTKRSGSGNPVPTVPIAGIACPNCGFDVRLPSSVALLASASILCAQCKRYFLSPSAVGLATPSSVKSTGGAARCSCGKAKRGHCFLCE